MGLVQFVKKSTFLFALQMTLFSSVSPSIAADDLSLRAFLQERKAAVGNPAFDPGNSSSLRRKDLDAPETQAIEAFLSRRNYDEHPLFFRDDLKTLFQELKTTIEGIEREKTEFLALRGSSWFNAPRYRPHYLSPSAILALIQKRFMTSLEYGAWNVPAPSKMPYHLRRELAEWIQKAVPEIQVIAQPFAHTAKFLDLSWDPAAAGELFGKFNYASHTIILNKPFYRVPRELEGFQGGQSPEWKANQITGPNQYSGVIDSVSEATTFDGNPMEKAETLDAAINDFFYEILSHENADGVKVPKNGPLLDAVLNGSWSNWIKTTEKGSFYINNWGGINLRAAEWGARQLDRAIRSHSDLFVETLKKRKLTIDPKKYREVVQQRYKSSPFIFALEENETILSDFHRLAGKLPEFEADFYRVAEFELLRLLPDAQSFHHHLFSLVVDPTRNRLISHAEVAKYLSFLYATGDRLVRHQLADAIWQTLVKSKPILSLGTTGRVKRQTFQSFVELLEDEEVLEKTLLDFTEYLYEEGLSRPDLILKVQGAMQASFVDGNTRGQMLPRCRLLLN